MITIGYQLTRKLSNSNYHLLILITIPIDYNTYLLYPYTQTYYASPRLAGLGKMGLRGQYLVLQGTTSYFFLGRLENRKNEE